MSRHVNRLVCVALLSLTSAAGLGHAQSKTDAVPSLSLRFVNGSMIQKAMLLDAVEMETKLGKLIIPANEIQRIDFGFRLSDADAKKVDQAMRDLASEQHSRRESASKTLLSLGKLAYPALMDNRKRGDLEMTRRIDAVLKDVLARNSADALHQRRTDIVRTSDSTVAGQIVTDSLRVRCEIFGDTRIPLFKMRDLKAVIPGGNLNVAVDAMKFGNKTSWLETEFETTLGTKVEITAAGEINLDPMNTINSPNARNVRPDGTTGLVSGEGFIPGQLVGRIGTDGPIFVIGSKHMLTPTREGRLYLRVVTIEHASQVRAEGSYQVKINAEPVPHLGNVP
jgi:hypothetical protein